MAKFDKCIMHIGTAKTGTTSLQRFLDKNRLVLAKKGILYPTTFGRIRHLKLVQYAKDYHKLDNLKEKFGLMTRDLNRKKLELTSKDHLKNFRKEITRSFQKEIQNTNCTKLLISSEGLSELLLRVKDIHFLKKFLDDFVKGYTIIVYLRSQHERAISGYSTRVGGGATNEMILPKKQFHQRFNYEKLLGRWADVFGDQSIIPRIFSPKELMDSDIKKDFVSLLGLNWNDFEDIESKNESMSAEAQRFLVEINKFLPRYIGGKVNENRGNLGNLVSRNFQGKGLLPTRQEAENFLKMFKDSNEKVRKKWFPEKKELFEVDFDKYPEKKELLEVDYDDEKFFVFEAFAKLWSEKEKEIRHLKKKLKVDDIEDII